MKTYPIATTEQRETFVNSIISTGTAIYHMLPNTNYTTCVLTFEDGWSTLGNSVCVDPLDFNQHVGESIAKNNAIALAETHYWRVAGYLAMIGQTEISYDSKMHS